MMREASAIAFVVKSMCIGVGQICLWYLRDAWLWKKVMQTHWDLVTLFMKWDALIKNVFGSKNKKIYQLLRGLFFWYNNKSRVQPSRPNVVVCQCCLGPGSLCLSALTSLAWRPLFSCSPLHVCKMAAAPSSSHQHFSHEEGGKIFKLCLSGQSTVSTTAE